MKTKAPKAYLHSRKIVLTRKEQQTWDQDYYYYLEQGYPKAEAERRAWDHFSINRRGSYVY